MRLELTPRILFLFGLALIVIVNGIVLAGILYNRYGEPDAIIDLTERELEIVADYHQENSGMRLLLKWRVLSEENDQGYYRYSSPRWFTAAKLEELGFDSKSYQERWENGTDRLPLPKKVYLVLDKESPQHDIILENASAAVAGIRRVVETDPDNKELLTKLASSEELLARERQEMSRLFAVDAGDDSIRLRERYGDRKRYMVVPAIVRMGYEFDGTVKKPRGYIEKLVTETIHVPLRWRHFFADPAGKSYREAGALRYQSTIAYGRNYAPWLLSVTRTEKIDSSN